MKFCNYLFVFLYFFCCLKQTEAGGFHLNLQGQKQLGMAHCGTASLFDASVLFFNPGAMSFLDSTNSICVGSNFIFPRLSYLEPSPGIYTSEMVHNLSTPFSFYAAFKFKKKSKWNAGVGIYTPFGSHAQWEDGWKGQFIIREIELRSFFIQPTFSYKINEKLGIGGAYVFATGYFYLRKGVPVQNMDGNYGEVTLSGKAESKGGYNIGLYYACTKKLTFGIDYRSAVTLNISSGEALFENIPSSLSSYFANTTFTTQLTLPSATTVGASYLLTDKIKIASDINYVEWSSYDTLSIDFAANTDKLADVNSARSYSNSFIYRLGAEYTITKKFTVRTGAYFDQSPVKNGFVSPESPDMNKIGFTLGTSVRLGQRLKIDASFLWIEGLKRSGAALETQFSGTYKVRALSPGLGLEYVF